MSTTACAVCDKPTEAIDDSPLQICNECAPGVIQDGLRDMSNRVWKEGGMEAVREHERRSRTCVYCGYEHSSCEWFCAICGKRVVGEIGDRT